MLDMTLFVRAQGLGLWFRGFGFGALGFRVSPNPKRCMHECGESAECFVSLTAD